MALLEVILEGDPRLRQKATKIKSVDPSLKKLAADMHETMIAEAGVGLAGPQVGIMRRIIVVNVPGDYIGDDEDDLVMTLLNPEIIKSHGEATDTEGCLSIPRWYGEVPRAERVVVKAMDLDGKEVRFKAKEWVARVLQHEIDHLNGILFVDRVVDKSTLRIVEDPSDAEMESDTLSEALD